MPVKIERAKRLGPSYLGTSDDTIELVDWKVSWKQRTVYVSHAMHIQQELVSTLTQRTNIFVPSTAAIHNASSITKMERSLGATLPMDFVIFLTHFAHHLCIDTAYDGKEDEDDEDNRAFYHGHQKR